MKVSASHQRWLHLHFLSVYVNPWTALTRYDAADDDERSFNHSLLSKKLAQLFTSDLTWCPKLAVADLQLHCAGLGHYNLSPGRSHMQLECDDAIENNGAALAQLDK